MGNLGQSCLSLAVDMVDWLLVLSVLLAASDSMSVSKELELCEDDVILDEGSIGAASWCSVVVCALPFKETRCMSNLFKQISAFGRCPEMGLD